MKQVARVCHGCPMNNWEAIPSHKKRRGRCLIVEIWQEIDLKVLFSGKGEVKGLVSDDVPPDCPRIVEHVVLGQEP